MSSASVASRNLWIDALRGLSVLVVIWTHIQIRIPYDKLWPLDGLPREIWRVLFRSGSSGVRIFFVLSGFLITRSLLRISAKNRVEFLKTFYRRRVAKIVPPLALLMVGLTLTHFLGVKNFTIQTPGVSYGRALLSVLTFHVNWLEGAYGYLPGGWDILWSLSVEEVFYLGYPFLLLATRSNGRRMGLLLIFVLIAPWVRASHAGRDVWQTKSYLGCMDALAIGCLGALGVERWSAKLKGPWLRPAGIAGVLGILWILAVQKFEIFSSTREHAFEKTILAFCVIAAVLGLQDLRSRALRPMASIGRASYEIYLFHMFFVFPGVELYRMTAQGAWNAWIVFFAITAVSVAAGSWIEAHFSHRWLER